MLYIILAVLMFGLLIAVHEFGHFASAKLFGIQVNEFSVGMGPTLLKKQKGETLYSLRALPIGGFCAMEGEDEDSGDERSLGRQGFWKKVVIFAAGSFMNFLAGFLIILAVYSGAQGFLIPAAAGTAPEFEERNGQAGDIFYSVNGERVYLYSDVSLLMSLHQGQPMDLVVLRDGEKVELNDVTWGTYTGTEGETYQGYGVYIARDQIEEANLWTILKTSWLNTIDFVRIVRLSLQMLVTGQAGMDDLSGPVGIVSTITQVGTASETIAAAVENILYFGAMLAVNLAVMNMLPIPALDGGKIFFLIIDEIAMKLFRKKIPEKYEMAVNTVGFVALMGFMLVVTFNDVFKLFG
mgnify:CR=1 FL=1